MNNASHYIILNDKLIAESKARIPAVTSGLYYGIGAFETFVSEKARIFKFQEHIQRLNDGLKYLGLQSKKLINTDEILDQIRDLLRKNHLIDQTAKVRIQVSLTENQGYSGSEDPSFITIITSEKSEHPKSTKSLVLSETSVVPGSSRPTQFKLSNMLHYRQAFMEAKQREADDSVMLTVQGFVAETSIANIFWMENEEIFTPSEECDILPGIMRNSIIDVLKNEMNYEVNEGNFSMDELLKADSVWITNSAIGFVPVTKIEDVSFNTGKSFFSDLSKLLSAYKKENMTNV